MAAGWEGEFDRRKPREQRNQWQGIGQMLGFLGGLLFRAVSIKLWLLGAPVCDRL